SIEPAQFERTMRMEPAARDAEITRLARNDERRAALLREAASAFDAAQAARRQLDDARNDPTGAAEIDPLVLRTAEAEITYENARTEAMTATISPGDVVRALNLSDRARVLAGERGSAPVTLPSPREQALSRLYEQHPEMKEQLDR